MFRLVNKARANHPTAVRRHPQVAEAGRLHARTEAPRTVGQSRLVDHGFPSESSILEHPYRQTLAESQSQCPDSIGVVQWTVGETPNLLHHDHRAVQSTGEYSFSTPSCSTNRPPSLFNDDSAADIALQDRFVRIGHHPIPLCRFLGGAGLGYPD